MMFSSRLALVASVAVAALQAQPVEVPPVSVRAVLHDPVHPVADFFVLDKNGVAGKLNLIQEGLPQPQLLFPVNGSLVFYKTASIDPKKPAEGVAATVKLPANFRRGIVIILPSPEGSDPPFRLVAIDDSPAVFPSGESRVLSLVPVETAIEAGEHKLPVSPGKITAIPPVKKINEYNMAQTNFYYKEADNWVPFTERQLQYLQQFRRIFLIHVTPGSQQPFVRTIVDASPVAPK